MPCIQQLNKDIGEDAAFRFVFEGSEFLNDLTEGLDPVECKYPMILLVFFSFHFRKKTKFFLKLSVNIEIKLLGSLFKQSFFLISYFAHSSTTSIS